MVDGAIATSVSPVPGRELFHLDIHLHRSVLTQLKQGAWLERDELFSSREIGLARFREAWTHNVAGLFVQATRFDPMHHAQTEQWLYDRLDAWNQHLAEHEHLDIDLPHQDRTHQVRLHRRQLLKSSEPLLRRLREFVSDAIPADQPVALQVTHRLWHACPGLVQALETLPNVQLVLLDELAAAQGIKRLYLGHNVDEQHTPFVIKLPWFNASDLDAHGDRLAGYERRAPTHLLHHATAYPLTNGLFSIGTASESGIRLDEHLPGVAAEHFRLRREGPQVVLDDLSDGTYGGQ